MSTKFTWLLFFLLSVPLVTLAAEPEDPKKCVDAAKNVASDKTAGTTNKFNPLSARKALREKRYKQRKAESLRETKLLEQIAFWMADRSAQSELSRSRQVLYLSRALEIDRPYTIIKKLRPLFKRIYESDYIVRTNAKLITEKERELKFLGKFSPQALGLQHEIANLKAESEKSRNYISKYIEEYSAAYSFLKKVLESEGPITEEMGEEALDASSGSERVTSLSTGAPLIKAKVLSAKENAKEVLEDLQPKYLLRHLLKEGEGTEIPTLGMLYKTVNASAKAREQALKRERNNEFVMWLLTVSPSQVAFDGIELLVKNSKFLDKPGLKALLNFLQQDKSRLIYSGDIARIVMSHGDPKKQLSLVEEVMAGSVDDGFLQTFAQGLESRNTWNALYEVARARHDQTLAEKMKAAKEVATRAGDISLVRTSGKEKLAHRLLNFVVGSLTVGGPAYFLTPSKNDDEEQPQEPEQPSKETNPLVVTKPVEELKPTEPTAPTEEVKPSALTAPIESDENEILKKDLDVLMEILEKDPAAIDLLKKLGMNPS